MLTWAGASTTATGIACAILGAAFGLPTLLAFGMILLGYMAWVAIGTGIAATALRADGVTVTRDLQDRPEQGAVLLGRELGVTVRLENRLAVGLARVTVSDTVPRTMRATREDGGPVSDGAGGTGFAPPWSALSFPYRSVAETVGRACFGGAQVVLSDALALFRRARFYAVVQTLNILPLPEEYGASIARGGRSRESQRHRSAQKGLGSEFHAIRPYEPGDPLRRIAWKVAARTARLQTREVEAELNIPCTVLVDASAGMKAGRLGRTKLDYVIRVAAVLATAAFRGQDPCGLGIFTDLDCTYLPPRRGRSHLVRLIRELAAAKERATVGDVPGATLSLFIQGYLHGVDRLCIKAPEEMRQSESVLAWVADEYGLSPEARHCLGQDPGFAREWMVRFCQDRGIVIPSRPASASQSPPSAPGRDRILLELVKRALLRAKERELFIILSDFEGVETSPVLVEALRLVRTRHHRVIVLSPFTPWFEREKRDEGAVRVSATEAAEEMYTLAFLRERAALRDAVRRLGIPVRDLAPDRIVRVVLEEVARLKHDRAAVV
jgi:uncharacterized protein (DUF58 family)